MLLNIWKCSLPAFMDNYITYTFLNTKLIVVKLGVVWNWYNVLGKKV